MLVAILAAVVMPRQPVNEHLAYGTPRSAQVPDSTLLVRKGFVVLHDNLRKVPVWVSFRLKDSYVSTNPRAGNFKADPDLTPGSRAELVDYKGSGFDRGHMAASGDMRRSREIQSESFYLSNIAPQNPSLNQGVWADIEALHRIYATEYGDVTIIVGPIFGRKFPEGPPIPSAGPLGPNRVTVPSGFFRLVIRKTRTGEYEALALVLPNRPPDIDKPLESYIWSVDEVEAETGLNFFNALPVDVQDRFEGKKQTMIWQSHLQFSGDRRRMGA